LWSSSTTAGFAPVRPANLDSGLSSLSRDFHGVGDQVDEHHPHRRLALAINELLATGHPTSMG